MNEFLEYFLNISTLGPSIGGAIIVIFGFLATRSTEKSTPKYIAWGAFTGGVIVIFFSFVSGFQQHKTEKELMKVTTENAKLSGRNANLVTGGDSYCYVYIPPLVHGGALNGTLSHKGAFPLYDVEMEIIDLTKWKKIVESGENTSNLLYLCVSTRKIGNMPASKNIDLTPIQISNANDQEYKFNFEARNGTWSQQIRLHRDPSIKINQTVNGVDIPAPEYSIWHQAFIIKRDGETIIEHIGPVYPRNDAGKVDW